MKRYVKNFLFISSLFVIIVFLLLSVRFYIANHLDWSLPKERHILFMGASHVARGINDSLTKEAVNVGSLSERYLYTYIKLLHYVEANPQIDTVFLQCSSTDLWQDTDYKYHAHNEQSFFISSYWPFFSKEQWLIFRSEPKQVFGVVMSSLIDVKYLSSVSYISSLGSYLNKIDDATLFDPAKQIPQLETGMIKDYGWYGYNVNYKYLRRIIDYCREHCMKLYLMHFPVFKPELYYDQAFCEDMRRKYFNDVEYLDYSHWVVADDERMDSHHLNHKGAIKLTKELKERFGFE
ncbi:hypothetical protein [Phocaeicola sp.]